MNGKTIDWTDKILVITMTNTLGEHFLFECPPDSDHTKIPKRASDGRLDTGRKKIGVLVQLQIPFGKEV